MDKIFGLFDFVGVESGSLNPLVLILFVFLVVVGAVSVFIFGFKNSEPPKLSRRSSDSGSKTKKQQKAKRGKPESVPPQKEAAKTLLQQKPGKKEASVKAITKEASAKPAEATAAVATKNRASAVAASKAKVVKNDTKKDSRTTSVTAKKVSNGKEILLAKRTDKTLDNTVADVSEWQTVTTKKQKKSTESLNQSTVEEGEVVNVVNAKENVKSPKNKQAKEKANKTKKASSAGQQKLQEPSSETLFEKVSVEVVGTKAAEEPVAVAANAEVTSAFFDLPKITENALKEQKLTTVEPTIEVVHVVNGQDSNLAINELDDPGWTEAAAPKKTKKRALRE